MLPSLARLPSDFDEVAASFATKGYRVLRPMPRGIGGSQGPAAGITLRDLAHDVAVTIEAEKSGPAIVLGHNFGNCVARMTAVAHPNLVRGIVLAAAAAKSPAPEISAAAEICADLARPDSERLAALRLAFFTPGADATGWLNGWHPAAKVLQQDAARASPRADWWHGGAAPILDLQAASDPFRPRATERELKDDLGERVTIAVVAHASHALFPEQPQAVVSAVDGWARHLLLGS